MGLPVVAIIIIPLFLGLATFLTRVSGEKEAERLKGEIILAQREINELRDRNRAFGENMEELRIYRVDVQEKTRYVIELERKLRMLEKKTAEECRTDDQNGGGSLSDSQ